MGGLKYKIHSFPSRYIRSINTSVWKIATIRNSTIAMSCKAVPIDNNSRKNFFGNNINTSFELLFSKSQSGRVMRKINKLQRGIFITKNNQVVSHTRTTPSGLLY